MLPVRSQIWRAANRLGGRRFRTWSQNDQYRQGRWSALGRNRRPMVTELVEKLADGGRVVEHACGEGHLFDLVDPGAYRHYTGYDISPVAIESATNRVGSARRRFEVQDMTTWAGDRDLDLIVAEECLNYLRPRQLERFLTTCRASLQPRGALLTTFYDPTGQTREVEICRAAFPDHELVPDPTGALVMVLRP